MSVTDNSITDGSMLPTLLDEIEEPIRQVSGDKAYDKRKCYDANRKRKRKRKRKRNANANANANASIPPQKGARIWQHANTYFSRLSECSVFAQQCQVEVQRRQLKRRRPGQVCAVNDGADWIPEVVTACRPDAVRILDFYHAAEHLAAAARSVFGENTPAFHAWFVTQRRELRDGDPDRVLEALADLASIHPQHAECINATQGYLLKRRDLIRYVEFKAAAWPMAPCII